MISSKTKIAWLVAAHVVATPTAAWLSLGNYDDSLPEFAFTTLQEAQITLLAIWLGLGTTKLRWRVVFVILGMCAESVIDALWYWCGFGSYAIGLAGVCLVGFWSELFVASITLTCIRSRFQLGQAEKESLDTAAFQFSIRQIMLLTFVVSVLLGLARVIPSSDYTPGNPLTFDELRASMENAVPTTLITLVIVWATMARGRPQLRLVLAILFGGCTGLWQSYSDEEFDWASCIAPAHAIIAIASLLVFRSAGWRLVHRQLAR